MLYYNSSCYKYFISDAPEIKMNGVWLILIAEDTPCEEDDPIINTKASCMQVKQLKFRSRLKLGSIWKEKQAYLAERTDDFK